MKYKRIVIVVLLLLSIGLPGLKAQNSLLVKEKTGTQTRYALTEVKKITFVDGAIVVNKQDGIQNTFQLTNLSSINFNDGGSTRVIQSETDNSTLSLFPNPVIDKVQIQFESSLGENVQVQIVDVRGSIIIQQITKCQSGINTITIPVSQLLPGIFFCRLQNGNTLDIKKFLKNEPK